MTNRFMKKLSTSLLLSSLLVSAACTKKRDAKLPDDEAEGTFAISEMDLSYKPDSSFSLKTGSEARQLNYSESSRADYEMGVVPVEEDALQIPKRLRYMFANLEVAGQTNQTYQIAFNVDNKSVTALKVVPGSKGLSRLEKQIALSKEEINLQKKIQTNRDARQTQKLLKQLAEAQKKRTGSLYVPIFKFEVKAYGVLEREKNSLGEDTAKLRLKATEWSKATHIQIPINPDFRSMVTADPSLKNEMDRVFVADRLNNKITTVGQLDEQLDVSLNLDPSTRILTLLDTKSLRIYEINQKSKVRLTESQKEILRAKRNNGEIAECSAEIKKALPSESQEGCIIIQRFNVPVSYVEASLPVVDYSGASDKNVEFKEVSSGDNTGLIKISKNVMPEEVQPTGNLDPRKTLRLADIKNKEFFFRRTLEDVSAMGRLSGGMAGNVQLVKFVLQDQRLVVQKTVGAIDFRKTTAMETEEVLSLPVKYIKRQMKDAAGNNLAVPKYVEATKEDAEYATLDWRNNTIPVLDSPLAFYADATCFANINNQEIVDTDMRLTEGVLSFSYLYSVTMAPNSECLSFFRPSGDYDISGGYHTQFVQQVRERISFKLNDGKTDKAFVPTTPFTAQNALNYGVFTKGVIVPSENGDYSREGSQINFPIVHDFRDGKKFLYTVGGLPDNDPKRRELLKRIAREAAAEWNAALHKAFSGTPLQRSDDYIDLVFAGENGVVAHLGDLDKNIIWFVDRAMDNGLLGVSQVGVNPRSGVVAADSLIVYNGNNASQLEYFKKYYKVLSDFKKGLKEYQKNELAKKQDPKDAEEADALENHKSSVGPVLGEAAAQRLFAQLKVARDHKKSSRELFTPNFGKTRHWSKSSVALNKSQWTAAGKKFGAMKSENGYIERIFKKALSTNVSTNPEAIEALTAKEVLATYGSKMTLLQKTLLQQKAALMDLHDRLDNFFKKNPGCALRMNQVITDSMQDKYLEMSEDELLLVSTKITLVHEMGHSLGLTHNFVGSYDKANFSFEGESSKRNYSSVMDYINDSVQIYEGLGPYDVYAIRAAYTGLLEVTPPLRSQSALQSAGFKGKLINNRFIDVRDIKENYAKSGWANFTGGAAKKLLMPFRYCTDKDVSFEPTCLRFDFGTTPSEIVRNMVKGYEDSYIVGRYAGDRLDFSWNHKVAAISRAYSTMLSVRHFLDEAFYRMILGIDENGEDSEHFLAAREAYKFLLNVIATPDTDKDFMDYSRFEKVTYSAQQPDGSAKTTVDFIEGRSQSDVALTPDRFHSLGNNIDKVLALEVLTLKGLGYRKYAQMNLNVSFLDYERLVGLLNEEGLSPVTFTIVGIMTNNLPGQVFKEGALLRSKNNVTVDSMLASYAAISAVLGLEAVTLDERDNFATLFKIGSSLGNKAPKDRVTLSPLGTVKNSPAQLSFWALDNANAANLILKIANEKNFYIDLGDQMTKDTASLMKAQATLSTAQSVKDAAAEDGSKKAIASAKKGLLDVLKTANKDGQIISAEGLTKYPELALEKQIETVEEMHRTLMDIASAHLAAKTPEEKKKVYELVGKLAPGFIEIGSVLPVAASAQKAAVNGLNLAIQQRQTELKGSDPSKDLQWVLLKTTANIAGLLYQSYRQQEQDYGSTMRNIHFLNKLTLMTNPEYNR